MSLAGWTAALMIAYLLLTFGARVAVQLRRTGKTGISSMRSAPRIELIGGVMFLAAVTLGSINPFLVLSGALDTWGEIDDPAVHAAGFALAGIGILGTFRAQLQMGTSWRIGVDPAETTALVTGGLFSLCRNPIYTCMLVAWAGFMLLLPTWVAPVAGALLLAGLEVQVRLVEEPHMIRTHGEPYLAWAAGVGRFLPGLGRLRGT